MAPSPAARPLPAATGAMAVQGTAPDRNEASASGAQSWASQVAQQGQASPFPWASPAPLGGVPDVAIGAYFVQFLVVLALLLGLLWLSSQLAKGKLRQGQLKLPAQLQGLSKLWALPPTEGPELHLEARLPLDAERTAYVLACEGQRWLLAAGPGAITVVAELEGEQSRAEAQVGGFAGALAHRGASPEGPSPEGPPA